MLGQRVIQSEPEKFHFLSVTESNFMSTLCVEKYHRMDFTIVQRITGNKQLAIKPQARKTYQGGSQRNQSSVFIDDLEHNINSLLKTCGDYIDFRGL